MHPGRESVDWRMMAHLPRGALPEPNWIRTIILLGGSLRDGCVLQTVGPADVEQMCVCVCVCVCVWEPAHNLGASSARGLWSRQFKGYSVCVCVCVCVGDWLGQVCPPVLQIQHKNVFFSTNSRTEALYYSSLALCLSLSCPSPSMLTPKGGEDRGDKQHKIIEIRRVVHVLWACVGTCMREMLPTGLFPAAARPSGRLCELIQR